jgi:purine-binding chemotaxis protein CheW
MKPEQPRRTESINWEKVRRRLARAMQATEDALRLSPEKARTVMEERAQALARVPTPMTPGAGFLEVVVFSLANERYGIETRHVREVVRLTDFTPLPGAPHFLIGVTNLRGLVLAIVDLRKFFGVPVRGLSDLSRVMVLGGERAEFGVLADAVEEVIMIASNRIEEPPETVSGVAREYLRGVTGDALILLDGNVLLQDRRLVVDQDEEAGA